MTLTVLTASLLALTGCVRQASDVQPPDEPPAQVEQESPLAPGEVRMTVGFLENISRRKVRKVRSESLATDTRKSFPAGTDILRILKYDEEVLTLPKMQASRDFTVKLPGGSPDGAERTLQGYSNVSYEKLKTSHGTDVLLLDSYIVAVDGNGTLSRTFHQPTGTPGVFRNQPAEIHPVNVRFQDVIRTRVIPSSERHYVIRFEGKQGMSILFEVRKLKGGSRPKVMSREKVTVPLGAPLIEINGHRFKVHTATTEFLDIERIS
ncbi:hypothetical protein [Desulfovibrio oxyclinae]|uniref:hypothetical protein n=1 Tax=Desulfovibrio oxyclinae TaxID=63560 RepID=UPI00036210F5|nr:hypothetical protein [Desulfovibrio oxyclinae]